MAYKICLFGDSGVGKTTLSRRYLTGNFQISTKETIGADIHVKYTNVEDIRVVAQIWDFAGENDYRFLLPSYASGTSGGIVMFDLTRISSLNNVGEWLELYKEQLTDEEKQNPILLVGGKSDLQDERTVSKENAIKVLKEQNLIDYIECSSKTGENIEDIFEIIIRKIMSKSGVI